jgi:hypothetical protein
MGIARIIRNPWEFYEAEPSKGFRLVLERSAGCAPGWAGIISDHGR